MKYRSFGETGWQTSEISLGTWALGGDVWGKTDDKESLAAINTAIDLGVNFIDTADVYGDGHSERLIAQVRKARPESLIIATKAGRRLNPHTAEGYADKQKMTAFVERSLHNLDVETLDLLQLHCPPTPAYSMPEVFSIMDDLQQQGKIRYYGVSVETVDEALKAIEYPNVKSVQIIFNMFRLKPTEKFFAAAREKNKAIIVRVPLASGLLSGKYTRETTFAPTDHRSFNRHGEAFDQGETFSGVDYNTGLQAIEEIRQLLPTGMTMAQFALRWILMFPEVSTVIPSAKTPAQATDNIEATDFPAISPATMHRIQEIYDTYLRPSIHARW